MSVTLSVTLVLIAIPLMSLAMGMIFASLRGATHRPEYDMLP